MEAQQQILLISKHNDSVCHQLTKQFLALGYCTKAVGFEYLGSNTFLSNIIPTVLYVDEPITTSDLSLLRSSYGLINILATHPRLINKQPELSESSAEFCLLPCGIDEISIRLQRSISMLDQNQKNTKKNDMSVQKHLIGQSECFLNSMALLNRYADFNVPVMIYGETGTGKELAARALHYSSHRKSMPFQALNCGALPDHLVENELFGHVRGAYTDAKIQQEGLVSLADGGTLFLDEIDSLPIKAQTVLLRFLQNGEYRPLGATKWKKSNARIISATNRNLNQLVEMGQFRSDLIYRVNTLTLELPPLRFRKDDILLLANHFLENCEVEFKKGKKLLHSSLKNKLLEYNWPGNVRELENYIQRSYLLSDRSIIFMKPEDKNLDEIPFSNIDTDILDKVENFSIAKKDAIDQFEMEYINFILKHTRGNVSKAAKLAGKERRVFGRLLKKHCIDKRQFIE